MRGNVKLLDKIFPLTDFCLNGKEPVFASAQLPCNDLLQDCSETNVYLWLIFSISFGEPLNSFITVNIKCTILQ